MSAGVIHGRGCDVGGECWSSNSHEPIRYVATRALERNTLIAAGDLKLSHELPAGALKYSPALKDFVGKYLQSGVEKDRPIESLNLSAEPSVDLAESQCLLNASLGAYASVVHLLKVGSRVLLACSPWEFSECGAREGKIVALLPGSAHDLSKLLVAVEGDRCDGSTTFFVVGLTKPAPDERVEKKSPHK